ncbi:MAG TPA: DUF222 domain-containing protein [Mycobacteriales bacterium]|nr:DUF222 domain-containing protein [Mycobacteriales bacterium]
MFDCRGAVLLTPPGWDEPDPPDLGDWEPIPMELLDELDRTAPDWNDGGLAFADQPVDQACRLPLGQHTYPLLMMTPVDEMSADARAWALKRTRELISHLEGFAAELTAALAGPEPDDRREDWGAHEVAVATRCSVNAADRQVALARDLAGRLRATRTAMSEGRCTFVQARALSEGVAHLRDDIAQEIEQRLLKFAHRQDLTKFKASLQRWLARLDPDFVKRAKDARAEVIVEHHDLGDGVGELFIRGPLERTAIIDLAMRSYATAAKPVLGGTAAGRKLAGLVQWAEDYLSSPKAPRRHGRAFTVNVTFDAQTMFGLTQHPAEIPGYGMVPAQAAIELLANGSPLRRLIIDDVDGHLLHYGTKTYLVPPPLSDHLIALHGMSAAPHSNVPAADCDMEHNIPFQRGGTTDPDNNTPVDRRWHRGKTHAGWTYVKNSDGSVTWTSPAGLTEIVYPHDYRLGP